MVLELRPAHDPTKAYGFVGVVTSLKEIGTTSPRRRRQTGSVLFWKIEG
jgi:selenium-binding protein 1